MVHPFSLLASQHVQRGAASGELGMVQLPENRGATNQAAGSPPRSWRRGGNPPHRHLLLRLLGARNVSLIREPGAAMVWRCPAAARFAARQSNVLKPGQRFQ
jgi:hypothetical protein